MNKKLRFIWIDDNPERYHESENLGTRLNVNVDFKDIKNKNLSSELNHILSGEYPPDLILMDHKLNDVKAGGFKTGSTATEVIREKWSEHPIVCITGVPLSDVNFDFHKQSIYEDIFDISKLSEYDSTLLSIAKSFNLLREKRPQNVDDLITMIKSPTDDDKRLKDVLSDNLKRTKAYEDKSLLMMISNWIRRTLMKRPGFLYDRLWTATLLGIREESFDKVEDLFIEAKYDGIFADERSERWWQTKLREIIFSKFPKNDTIFPWVLGRQLSGITEEDFSKCYASSEDFPETVAFIDETAIKSAPMRIRHTVPHPNFEKLLFFEEIRMMKGAE